MKPKNTNAINKIIALAVSLCVISAFLISAGYALSLVQHYNSPEHGTTAHSPAPDENHCSKCCTTCVIYNGINGLVKYSDVIFAVVLTVLALFTVLLFNSALQAGFPTLVSLKLRMNN